MRLLFVLSIFLLLYNPLTSQNTNDNYSDKVSSLDSIIYNLYDVISGDKGVHRDWVLFEYLFAKDAKLIPTRRDKSAGTYSVEYLEPKDYIEKSGPFLFERGFHEKEISRITESFGSMTHVFSTYEAYWSEQDELPFMRGINSIQLLYDNDRWWIVNIYWQAESQDVQLTDKYLPK